MCNLSKNFRGWGQIFLVNYNPQTYGQSFSSPFFQATPTFWAQKHFFNGPFKKFGKNEICNVSKHTQLIAL